MVFDGEDDVLRCSTPLALAAQREFTLVILCRTEFTAEREWPQRLFSLEPTAGADYSRPEAFAVTLTDAADPAQGGGLSLTQFYDARDRLSLEFRVAGADGVFQHALAWVKTESAPGQGVVRLYVDGEPAGTDTYAFELRDVPANRGYLLGTRADDTARCAPVELFEILLYNRAFSVQELTALPLGPNLDRRAPPRRTSLSP